MKPSTLAILVCLALAATTWVQAVDDFLVVDLLISRDGIVTVEHDPVAMRGDLARQNTTGPVKLILEDARGRTVSVTSFEVEFLAGEPLRPVPSVLRRVKVPYHVNARQLNVYFEGQRVLEYPLADLCNDNGTCDELETQVSCPLDCTPGVSDGICVGEEDDACDPDCPVTRDPDCLTKYCGNGRCERWEHSIICRADCPLDVEDDFCVHVEDGVCDPDCLLREDPDCFKERCPGGNCAPPSLIKEREAREAVSNLSVERLFLYFIVACGLVYAVIAYLDRRRTDQYGTTSEEDDADATKRFIRIKLDAGTPEDDLKELLESQGNDPKIVDDVQNEEPEEE